MSTHDFGELPILRANLDALAERDSPVSAVDIRAARRAGDRVKKRRTTGRIGAVTAVVVAGALCFTALPSALQTGAFPQSSSTSSFASFLGARKCRSRLLPQWQLNQNY